MRKHKQNCMNKQIILQNRGTKKIAETDEQR